MYAEKPKEVNDSDLNAAQGGAFIGPDTAKNYPLCPLISDLMGDTMSMGNL